MAGQVTTPSRRERDPPIWLVLGGRGFVEGRHCFILLECRKEEEKVKRLKEMSSVLTLKVWFTNKALMFASQSFLCT